jgi:hypothetical protein
MWQRDRVAFAVTMSGLQSMKVTYGSEKSNMNWILDEVCTEVVVQGLRLAVTQTVPYMLARLFPRGSSCLAFVRNCISFRIPRTSNR